MTPAVGVALAGLVLSGAVAALFAAVEADACEARRQGGRAAAFGVLAVVLALVVLTVSEVVLRGWRA